MLNDAESFKLEHNTIYHLENVLIDNSRGLSIYSAWFSNIIKTTINQNIPLITNKSINISDITMICPLYANFGFFLK